MWRRVLEYKTPFCTLLIVLKIFFYLFKTEREVNDIRMDIQ